MRDKRSLKNRFRDKVINNLDSYILRHSLISIIMVYNTVLIITSAALYKLIPILLCYEENVRESSRAVDFSYDLQFIIGTFVALAASTIILRKLFKDIDSYKLLSTGKEEDVNKLKAIRRKCMNMPYIIYLCQISVPAFIIFVICILARVILGIPTILVFKLISVVFSFCFLSAIIAYTFSRRIFSKILYNTYSSLELEGFRIEIGTKISAQIIPMIITSILVTSLLGYSKLIDEKGNLLQETYRMKLEENVGEHVEEIKDQSALFEKLKTVKLAGVKTSYFIATGDNGIITSDGAVLPAYLTNFIKKPVDGYKIYGYTKEVQGTIKKINIKGRSITAGVVFEVESPDTVMAFIIALIIMLIINVFVIYCFSRSISGDIAHVADNLMKIGQRRSIGNRKTIPVLSNDEIGDLITAFNKIQKLETEYDEMKNEFFANVSHELRTPLNIILASIQLLSSLDKNDNLESLVKNVDRLSEMIKQNSYRLLRLVNNLIDSSRIKASFYDMHMKNYNIVNVVEEISLSAADYIEDKNIDFLFDTDIEERIMACDADMIERIMLNLLSNAVKFTAAGGNIFVKVQEENNNVIISVKDSGIGMNEDEQKIIFERFKQVDKSLTRKREGSGIGLSLVKLLVEMHKGTISVKSEPCKGSEFIITLPVRTIDEVDNVSYLDRQISSEKVDASIEKIKVEFSDIYF